jgi:O-antigen ligase
LRPTAERLQIGFFGGFVASSFVSIFASQAFLVLAAAVFGWRALRGRVRPLRTPADGPILGFAAFTLLSVAFSVDPAASLDSARKLLLLVAFFLAVDTLAGERDRERVLAVAFLAGALLSGYIVVQFHFLGYHDIDNRPRGFLGHYMSATGLVMTILTVAAARLGFGREAPRLGPGDGRLLVAAAAALALLGLAQASGLQAVFATRLVVAALAAVGVWMAANRGPWPGAGTAAVLASVVLPLGVYALLVSRTRNAWVGGVAGLVVVALLRAPRALWLLGGLAAVLLALRPTAVIDRLTVTDASSVDRYYQWQAGIDMIRDKPMFGQGPGMILRTYPRYRWPEAPNTQAPHLHNNALQLAAERGLPCLAFWLWWMAVLLADSWREAGALLKQRPSRGPAWVAVASLAALVALMLAGLFEYNFGDSEVLMFLLLVSALPYALRRGRNLFPA